MRITILGCGSSLGVPQIGCECSVCASTNPKNKRTRVSVLVETQGRHILIDTSPDLRQQALTNKISRIDAILYTHDHADHLHGIDDMRMFNVYQDASIPIYADQETRRNLIERFPYVFQPKPSKAWYRPSLEAHTIPEPLAPFDVLGVEVRPFLQRHGEAGTSIGYRIGNFAYSTDTNGFPEESFTALQSLDLWVVDCLRYTPSYTHAKLEDTLAWIGRVSPARAVLTHMAHEFDYEVLSTELPEGVTPAYDGMVLEIPDN